MLLVFEGRGGWGKVAQGKDELLVVLMSNL